MAEKDTPEDIAKTVLQGIRSGRIDALAIVAAGPENFEFFASGLNEPGRLTNIIAALRLLDHQLVSQVIIGDISRGPKAIK